MMKTKKEKYLVLSVELKHKGINLTDSVDEMIEEIVDQIESISIAEISGGAHEIKEATKRSCEKAIGKLTGATAIICPTPLDRIAFLHAIHRWGLELEFKWASGARIIRRFHHYEQKLAPEELGGYDIEPIFKEFIGDYSKGNIASNYASVLLEILEKRKMNSIDELLKESQLELRTLDNGKKIEASKLITTRGHDSRGPFNERIVVFSNFAGRRDEDIHRKQSTHWAAGLGFEIKNSVTKENETKEVLVESLERKDDDPDTGKMTKAKDLHIPIWKREDFHKLVCSDNVSVYRKSA